MLDWSPYCEADSYDVALYYWQSSSSSWVWYHEWPTTDDFKEVWPVVSTDFYFEVRANNAAGAGPWSSPAYFAFTAIE